MHRRHYLTLTGASLTTLAGCSSGGQTSDPVDTASSSPTPSPSPTPTQSPTATESPTPTRTPTPDPYDVERARELAIEPSYDNLFRNFETYQGDPVRFEHGQVYQAVYQEDSEDYLQLFVANNDDEWEGDIAAFWNGDRVLEDDYLNPVLGIAEDLYEYETTNGNWRTIPLLSIVDLEVSDPNDPPRQQ